MNTDLLIKDFLEHFKKADIKKAEPVPGVVYHTGPYQGGILASDLHELCDEFFPTIEPTKQAVDLRSN